MARHQYMMTQAQYDAIIEACRPIPLVATNCGPSPSQQERANAAWDALGKEMGFVGKSVAPGEYGKLSFTAEPLK